MGILSIFFLVNPDTYFSNEDEAVLILTPTLLTVLLTTKSRDSSNLFCTVKSISQDTVFSS